MPVEVMVRITAEPLVPADALAFVADPASGGTCLFVGTVRDNSDAGEVTGLEYEAWEELAERRLRELAEVAAERWPVQRIALLHRTGRLAVGEPSVAVAVSAAHRAEAFEACRFAIDELKHDVPIWKKELLASGEADWVMGA
jgi:molybdopterin synthase catalytic subunit